MGYMIMLLFTRDQTSEPEAILQDDTSGECLPDHFYDWRDAIHYLNWVRVKEYSIYEPDTYEEWATKYGYMDDEEFNGDRNEYKEGSAETSIGYVSDTIDINSVSAWTYSCKDEFTGELTKDEVVSKKPDDSDEDDSDEDDSEEDDTEEDDTEEDDTDEDDSDEDDSEEDDSEEDDTDEDDSDDTEKSNK